MNTADFNELSEGSISGNWTMFSFAKIMSTGRTFDTAGHSESKNEH
jgi:hypothetical protein